MKSRLRYALLFAAVSALAACGENSDLNQKIDITADKVEKKTGHEGQREIIATGHAKLTKGSLTITGESINLTYDQGDEQHALAEVRTSGERATVRQKRKGTDKWIEGESDAILLNLQNDNAAVILQGKASLHQIAGGKTVDASLGESIAYDMRSDTVKVYLPAKPPANAMSPMDARAYVCTAEPYHEVRDLDGLEPPIAKMMEGVISRKDELNAGEVGMPGIGFVLAAASKNAVMVAVDRDQDRHDLSIWFFIKEDGKWKRGHDFQFASEPPRSVDELLRNAYGSFGCKGVPVSG